MTCQIVTWKKPGAQFADTWQARQDLASKMPADFIQLIRQTDIDLVEKGIFTKPVEHVWDQATQTLRFVRCFDSYEAYQSHCPYDSRQAKIYNEQAGWTLESIVEVP